MSITSPALLVLLFGGAIAVPIAAVIAWNRVRGPGWARVLQRLGAVVLAQVLLTVGVLAYVNDVNSLYPSWSDLFPQSGSGIGPIVALAGSGGGNGYQASGGSASYVRAAGGALQAQSLPPAGFVEYRGGYKTVLHGASSGVNAPVYVWLPPEYFLPANAHVRFPVVELLGGYPGTPATWLGNYHLARRSADAQALGAHPFIFVMPTINVAGRTDLECSDIPGHPAVGTFISKDVPAMVARSFRTLSGPRAWGTLGFSEGGFCALKLAAFAPRTFGAAVSFLGYGYPSSSQFGSQVALRRRNSPDVRLAQYPAPRIDILLAASKADRGDYAAFKSTVSAVRAPTRLYMIVLSRGGHVDRVWLPLFTPAVVWLSHHLRAPTSSGR